MPHLLIRHSCALLTALVLIASTSAGDWRRFHGPNGTGTSSDKIPTKWTAKNILWKKEIPGVGKSSPIVVDGKVYLQSSSKDGSSRTVYCFDVNDGSVKWQKSIPGRKAHTHRLNTLASSTGASDGKNVYFAIWDGQGVAIHAWDLNGKELWKTPLGRFKSQHGPGGSPAVYDGIIYYAFDMDGKSTLYALDVEKGTIKWSKPRKAFRASYSTPFLRPTKGGGNELIILSTAGFSAYEPKSGKLIWDYTWDQEGVVLRTVGCAAYTDGIVVGSSGNGGGSRRVIAVKAGGSGDITQSGLAWKAKKSFPYVPSMIAKDGYFYAVHDKGIAYCFRARDGKEMWKQRLGGNVSSSPVMSGDTIFAPAENGDVYVFKASPKFQMVTTNNLQASFSASPAIGSNRLFLRSRDSLICIGQK